MLLSRPAVAQHIIHNIKPVEQPVKNRPADRTPVHIRNDHRQPRAEGQPLLDVLGDVVVDDRLILPLFPVNQLFHRNLKYLRDPLQGIDIGLGLFGLPV